MGILISLLPPMHDIIYQALSYSSTYLQNGIPLQPSYLYRFRATFLRGRDLRTLDNNVIPNRVDRPIDPLTSSNFIARSTRNYSNNHYATKNAYFKSKLGGARGEDSTRNIRAEKARNLVNSSRGRGF
jgi:hypothetical protein